MDHPDHRAHRASSRLSVSKTRPSVRGQSRARSLPVAGRTCSATARSRHWKFARLQHETPPTFGFVHGHRRYRATTFSGRPIRSYRLPVKGEPRTTVTVAHRVRVAPFAYCDGEQIDKALITIRSREPTRAPPLCALRLR
jgi:hypothetical protein